MLDWFSGLIGYDASELSLGAVVRLSPEGEILSERETWEEVEGSYSTTMQLTRDTYTSQMMESHRDHGFLCSPWVLRLSGNPSKFLQGHNLAGPSVSVVGPVMQAVVRSLPARFRPADCDSECYPAVQRSRIDVTVMVDLGNHETVHEWLSHAATETRSRHGRALQSGETVYWGKHSSRWGLKAYCKRCELEAHPQPGYMSPEVLDWAERMLRLELVLRRPELKDRGTLDESVIWEFMSRIEVGVMKPVAVDSVQLPRVVRDTFRLWVSGHDVRKDRPARTFYRQRRMILDALGVDISLTPTEQMQALEGCSFDRNLFDIEVLKSRVTKEYPRVVQASLFDAPVPKYGRLSARSRRGTA